MTEHCEFCAAPPVRVIAPKMDALRSVYGSRLACERHLHWVRRLLHLDLGNVRLEERAYTGGQS